MERANRDIYPSEQTIAAYPRLAPFVNNQVLQAAFDRHENAANFWKRAFHWGGFLSLAFLASSTGFVGFELTIGRLVDAPDWLGLAAAIGGGLGLLTQVLIAVFRPRTRWLLHRFGAERIRSVKFLALMRFSLQPEGGDAQREADAFIARAAADVSDEVSGGEGALDRFRPADVVPRVAPGPHADHDLVQQAWAYYDSARLDVQTRHFASRIRDCESQSRTPGAVSDMLFLAAATMSFVELVLRAWETLSPGQAIQMPPMAQAWWYFLIWVFFVSSAAMMVFHQASAHEANSDRYAQYSDELDRLPSPESHTDLAALLERMYVVEVIVLRELKAFLHDHRGRSYIL